MEFMKFKDDAKKIINNSFNLRRAPLIHLKYPKKNENELYLLIIFN